LDVREKTGKVGKSWETVKSMPALPKKRRDEVAGGVRRNPLQAKSEAGFNPKSESVFRDYPNLHLLQRVSSRLGIKY
jgi:hypothetical protein